MTQRSWHQLQADDALAAQQTTASGLHTDEAVRRLAEHGSNRLTPSSKRGPLLRFLLQFHNVLIYVLLEAAFVTALLASGDKVPADLRLLKTKSLRIEEAALTGESKAVEKDTAAVAANAVLGDRYCMA